MTAFTPVKKKIIEDFGKEIRVHNSSFDDVNITIDGDTAAYNTHGAWVLRGMHFPKKSLKIRAEFL